MLIHIQLLNRELVMEKGFLDQVEDNAVGYMLELWDFTRISVTQNDLQKLKEYWNPAYSCFTFGKVDLGPTVEEYTTLLCCPRIQADKAYSRATNVPTFLKRLMSIMGINTKKRVDIFALSIYGLVFFPKALGHIDEAASDLFDQHDKRVAPVPTILAETFRSLCACQRTELFSVERVSGYPKARQHFGRKVNGSIGQGSLYRQHKDWLSVSLRIRLIEEHLQVIPSELEIVKQDFEKRSSELGKKIEQLEEEKMQLGLDIDVQKLEAEKMRKGKNKAEEELDSLRIDYKKLRLLMRTTGLGKTSKQWWQEIKEKKIKADQWEKKFQDARVRENALERDLLESQNENVGLRAWVVELERSRHQYSSHNSVIEWKVSLNKIEELKGKIEELENALQNCELQVELLEMNNEHWKEQFQHSQGQIMDRDHIIGEAVTQVWEVANHLQTLVVQADMLSLKYESESDQGWKLAWLLRKVKALSIRARAMDNADYLCGVDLKELSLVVDLDRLIRSAAKWYNQLSLAKINSWKDLAQAFMKQYSHNETIMLFINTLKAPFINHMLGSATKSLSDIVMSGEMIENAVRSGKINVGENAKKLAPR
ncbi:hypothetical protein Goshw_003761 [Gossypium schwendimanii]|uniref:DUF7745 domain-containing protein n=1 Tax=Gossypium schwendimanii TaxID=34291 RepID=A0A7J9LDV5_GOSSC|nr:hypothetical protein [Gossypium schwendimanii]